MLILSSTVASAKMGFHYLSDLNAKATPEETKNLQKHMNALKSTPAYKDPHSGKPVFKVISVEKGSFYEKMGVKAGDLFMNSRTSDTP